MENLWLLLTVACVIGCCLVVRKQQKQINALLRWRELIEQRAAAAAPEQEYA